MKIQLLPHGQRPRYETPGAAGMDLRYAGTHVLTLMPGSRSLIPTGIKIALDKGTEAQVRPRSGLALKHGVTVLNSPGTIDADYRGEIKVILINHGQVPFTINPGDRIAQLVVAPVLRVTAELVDHLPATTTRGSGGFGSTGIGS